MSANTSIQWTDRTWNPVRGCSVISPGCVNCYAMKQAHRFSGAGKPYEGLTKQTKAGPQWTGVVRTVDSALLKPLSWRKPARVFVNSMSDLFHEDVPDAFIDKVFAVMALASQHTFQILTKRAERMRAYLPAGQFRDVHVANAAQAMKPLKAPVSVFEPWPIHRGEPWQIRQWPLPNVWLGVSVENQKYADERIPLLLQTPAAVRFISAEPLLGPVLLDNGCNSWLTCTSKLTEDAYEAMSPDEKRHIDEVAGSCCESWNNGNGHFHGIDWVIVGGESGPGARPFNVAWARSIVEQCKSAGVPVFVKQLGRDIRDRNDAGFLGEELGDWPDVIDQEDRIEHDLDGSRDGYQGAPVRIHLRDRKGGDPAEWPEDLRVREFPELRA